MIPRAGIELWIDDPGLASGLPAPDEVEAAGFADGNDQYEDYFAQASWDEAAEALNVERDLIRIADASASAPSEFDSLIDGDLEDWQQIALSGLDAGVATAVLALNAAGCVTTTSCRGHPGRYANDDGRDYPRVRFMADPARAMLVRDAAAISGCGFGVEPPIVEVFAQSLTEMMAFAEAVLAARGAFDALPAPAHCASPTTDEGVDSSADHHRDWTLHVSHRTPFEWIRVDAHLVTTCPRCGTDVASARPALVDWLDRASAHEQRVVAEGVPCTGCGLLMPIDHPLLQYRRGDVPGLVVAFPATSPFERDQLFIQDVVAVADPSELDGAGVAVSARMHWWDRMWNRPLGPVLAGLAALPLPEADEEAERWRLATVAALDLPAVVDALTRFVTSEDYEQARALARDNEVLVSPRWRLTVDAAADALLDRQVDAEAADLLRHRLGRLRQIQLLGVENADDAELSGDLARLVAAATSDRGGDVRLAALLELRRTLELDEPTPLAAAAQTSLVVALLQDPSVRANGLAVVEEAERAVELASSALGDAHLLTRTAAVNLAVAIEQRPDVDREVALAAAEAILYRLAPTVSRAGGPLVADVATNLATIASQRSGRRADNPEETAALLEDARHISRLLRRDDRRSELVALVDAAASLRARMTGSLRVNALQSLAQLREATALEAEWKVLSPAESVLLRGNLANALHHVHQHAPGATSSNEVAAAARDAADAVRSLDRLHPVAIDTLNNAGSVLADLYSESLRDDAPDRELWRDARDYLLDSLDRAEALYPRGHPARLRAMANLATAYARPVDGTPADPERSAELLEAVITDAPLHRSEFALAAATNLGQLRIGQGRWDDASNAFEVATSAQRQLIDRARTPMTKLAEIVSTADLAARRALSLAVSGRYVEAVDALEENRGRLVRFRRSSIPHGQLHHKVPPAAVVHAATCDYGTVVVIRVPDGTRFGFHTPLTSGQVKPVAQHLLRARDRTDRVEALDRLQALLGTELLDPITTIARSSIIPIEEIHVIACGPLAACPLHSICDDEGRRWTDDWTVRFLMTSASSPSMAAPAANHAVAIIDPAGDLPFARAERDALAAWIGDVREPPAGWSSRSWLLGSLSGATVAHLACHASADADDPMRSSFQVGPDELVSADDLAALDTPTLELVVAPACQSASASTTAPDELLGVAHALVHAGARSVVASLWDADDAATALVVARLYHSIRNGSAVAQALAEAQRFVQAITGAELADLARKRLDQRPDTAWLPYDLAIEFHALAAHPSFAWTSAAFDHPADWANLSYLEG